MYYHGNYVTYFVGVYFEHFSKSRLWTENQKYFLRMKSMRNPNKSLRNLNKSFVRNSISEAGIFKGGRIIFRSTPCPVFLEVFEHRLKYDLH